MARLRRPLDAWHLVDDVGADRRGRRRRTAARWPDTRRRVSSVQLDRFLKQPIAVTETRTLSTFYSQITQWFWLGFGPLDRATRALQLWLQDQSLTRSRFQTTKLQTTLGRNCVIQHLAKFG